MKININIKNSKITVSWGKVEADYFRIFCKLKNNFVEWAKVIDTNFTTLSFLPFGENTCYVQAVKDGEIIDETEKRNFNVEEMDVAAYRHEDGSMRIFYSEYPNSQGYRLYRDNNDNNFGGRQNSLKTYMRTEYFKNCSYKIKPFVSKPDNSREFLYSSKIFQCMENNFEYLSIYKSYGENLFLSWLYNGRADGFAVFQEGSDYPVFETSDNLRHYACLKNYNINTKFCIKAYLNSPNGRIYIKTSDFASCKEKIFKETKVSLIIPAYNAQDYIARSIDTALASTFNDFEIIIVNDGSTDSTQKIIDWYESEYENVRSLQKINGGVADTRNAGIKMARGEYIAFMDNDDMIRPDMIEKLYNSITKNNCDIAIAPLYRLVDNGYTTHCNLPFETDKAIDIDKYLSILYTPNLYNCAIWNKLYRASIVKAHPLGILKYEDVSWTPCILSYAKTFCFLDTPFYEWDRKLRPQTFGDVLAKMPEDELFEHRKQAMLFFVENGNPEKIDYLKAIAIRRLLRYDGNSSNPKYKELIERLATDEYVEY